MFSVLLYFSPLLLSFTSLFYSIWLAAWPAPTLGIAFQFPLIFTSHVLLIFICTCMCFYICMFIYLVTAPQPNCLCIVSKESRCICTKCNDNPFMLLYTRVPHSKSSLCCHKHKRNTILSITKIFYIALALFLLIFLKMFDSIATLEK